MEGEEFAQGQPEIYEESWSRAGRGRGDRAVGGWSLVDLDVKDLDTMVLVLETPILIPKCSVQAPGEGTWRLP